MFSVNLLILRVFVSSVGLVGNVCLILFIIQTKSSHVKSFELFLLGLAAANLEEIVILNVYVTIVQTSAATTSALWCRTLKFLTVCGEMASILFTVVISVYRYQKLRDAKRANFPICLDGIRYAWMLSGACVMFSVVISLPIYAITLQGSLENITDSSNGCSQDFLECAKDYCPTLYRVYKYLFMPICYLLPIIIVTVSGCLIIVVLLNQEKMVAALDDVTCPNHHSQSHGHSLHRSTVAVVAAMWLFQVDWTLYLILLWTLNDFDSWMEIEFFISTSYSSISPYVYGIGNNLFSVQHFKDLFLKL
ncbi:uncharacterized protein ora6 [Nothobranchius furzeri]|uniref:LOC107378063-like protein n=1 Tax=Nothobranchius furzeri TaxID=105023 RepID=A0A9D3C610_NOTFU|nr:uncharacterized protein LOC107378063 [Nothobranchius furzeri]KAF7231294.1 putative LOC107378063-like protein [Nothobranchius furzeri]